MSFDGDRDTRMLLPTVSHSHEVFTLSLYSCIVLAFIEYGTWRTATDLWNLLAIFCALLKKSPQKIETTFISVSLGLTALWAQSFWLMLIEMCLSCLRAAEVFWSAHYASKVLWYPPTVLEVLTNSLSSHTCTLSNFLSQIIWLVLSPYSLSLTLSHAHTFVCLLLPVQK